MEAWPTLEDEAFLDFVQQYASRLCKRTTVVLRKFAKGFIACKYSALAYLLIGILWLDHTKTKEEKIELMTKFNVLRFGTFQNKQLEHIFMLNKRCDPSKNIDTFDDIEFEDNIALLGIVENNGYAAGEIYHYFLVVKGTRYTILSSYGSDAVSIFQYKTNVTPESLSAFIKSLKKEVKTKTDIARIRGFMRAHFLNATYTLDPTKNTAQQIHDEVERYIKPVSRVIQFQGMLRAIHDEITLKGGMRKKQTRKGKCKHYVHSRRCMPLTLHKK